MFLIIFEDGEIKKMEHVPASGDLLSCDNGLCSIVNISDPLNLEQWSNGWWKLIESV